MSTADLAHLSNNLLYSAMVVYAFAMYLYTAELAFGSPRRRARTAVAAEDPVRELASIGATSTYAGSSSGQHSDPIDTGGTDHAGDAVGAAGAVGAIADGRVAKANRLGRMAVSVTVLAFLLHAAAVVARGLAVSRPPWGNMFEFSTAASLAVSGVFLVVLTRKPIRYLGTFVVLPVLLTLGLAVTVLYTEAAQLVPALKSVWLIIHVTAARIASGIFTLGFALAICYLVQERRERVAPAERGSSFMDRLPAAAVLDRTSYRMHAFGYPIWTFAVIASAR